MTATAHRTATTAPTYSDSPITRVFHCPSQSPFLDAVEFWTRKQGHQEAALSREMDAKQYLEMQRMKRKEYEEAAIAAKAASKAKAASEAEREVALLQCTCEPKKRVRA